MKILVISLLRLGDVIQQSILLKGLRQKYPNSQLHLLVNRQFSQIEKLLGSLVDEYIYFDRESLQKGLGEANYNILWSYSEVERLVHKLNEEAYDLALNLTHNKLSAHLLGALQVSKKIGLYQQGDQYLGLSNRWIRYFNDRFSGTQKSQFHYLEILSHAFHISLENQNKSSAPRKKSKLILFQCLTSDEKKNWGLEKFYQLKNEIETGLVDYKIRILGAPFEREILSEYFREEDLLISDLVAARQHLNDAALLVTGDTSIKHMAAELDIPIVEIAIGSSDSIKTGAFSANALILNSSVECAPCSHSGKCSQSTHRCAEEVSVEKVFQAVWTALSNEQRPSKNISYDLDRLVWTLYLNKNDSESQVDYNTAAQRFLLDHPMNPIEWNSSQLLAWHNMSEKYRAWQTNIQANLPDRQTFIGIRNFKSSDISGLILCAQDILKSRLDRFGYFHGFIEALTLAYAHPVQIYDRVEKALSEIEELLTIRETLTQTVLKASKEGTYYAKGIGKLSISGFDEPRESLRRDQEDSRVQSRNREDATP